MCRRCSLQELAGVLSEKSGQSTVEYLLVLVAFLAAICALGTLWHGGREGSLLKLAIAATSRSPAGNVSALRDVLLF